MNWKASFSLVALFICGCSQQTLYTGLPEKDANDMVAILLFNQVNCDKVPGIEGTWNIVVEKNQFTEAVSLLNEVGYPKDKFSSMGDVFKKSGLVSSPLEERARFMHALSEQLAETLTHIHGIVTARVHIVLPDNDPYSAKTLPSSASVFISYLPQVNLDDCVRDIRQLVTNSIEGLTYDKVNVVLFPATNPKERLPLNLSTQKSPYTTILSMKIAKDSVLKFWFFLGALSVGAIAILGGTIFFLKQKQSSQS
ncbi:MAG: type III secretion inner membrane ring lipoprotein SctJ [Puniceicoccales bacterium]|jgi:type III secretion protein J|nr:type III secretion inner membrane ring lipoprotein SctJ [Puniceicoccales bacterium]